MMATGQNWRKDMRSIMTDEPVWSDLKYTYAGKTYVIPNKMLSTAKKRKAIFEAIKSGLDIANEFLITETKMA